MFIAVNMYGDASVLLVIAVFGTALMGVFGAVALAFRVRARDLRHLGTATTEVGTLAAIRPVLERLAYIASLLPQRGHREWARQKLQQANLIQQWSPELLQTMKLLASISMFFISMVLCKLWGMGTPIGMILVVSFISYFIPDFIVYSRAGERQDNMRKALPFVIDLLAVSAEAGLAFQQAIRNVVTNAVKAGGEGGERELIREFELTLSSLQMGRTMAEALGDTANRISLEEFNVFANAILQAERLGTPVSETLKSQSDELRVKIQAKVETKANQAPVKILFPLILFIFPVTAWVIIGPVLLRVLYGG
ncbi:MAG: type II secretion system F family protein [Planctomycetes bacterium]|nr:type II secretion system F family protein [Planctomycetota bacterium]